jgi:homocysteine S-methyltransferase
MGQAEISLTDGGIETTLVYIEGFDLPGFAAFPLIYDEAGRDAMRRFYEPFFVLAAESGRPFVLNPPTWRANRDWGATLGYDEDALATANADAVAFVRGLAAEHPEAEYLLEGVLGPRGDAYVVGETMTVAEAAAYHAPQIAALSAAGIDRVAAMTLGYADEAAGIALAARDAGVPVVLSFTVETDGRLPDGSTLGEAIASVDAATGGSALFYMVNCAYPTHVALALDGPEVRARLRGVRFNASSLSHAELDAATELDDGDPDALARDAVALRPLLPALEVLGGCCGTDARHVRALAAAW